MTQVLMLWVKEKRRNRLMTIDYVGSPISSNGVGESARWELHNFLLFSGGVFGVMHGMGWSFGTEVW